MPGKAEDDFPIPGSMNELKNKTVKQLRAQASELNEEGVIRATRTEASPFDSDDTLASACFFC